MVEVNLEFLGEQIRRIQSELRELRGVRADVAHLRAEVSDANDRINNRIDRPD